MFPDFKIKRAITIWQQEQAKNITSKPKLLAIAAAIIAANDPAIS